MSRSLLAACLALVLSAAAQAQFDPATADPDASTVADNGDIFIAYLAGPLSDVYRFAKWDGAVWTAYDASIPVTFAPPPTGVRAIAASPTGDALYVAGRFTTATNGDGSTEAVANVARLDLAADAWVAMGDGLDAVVNAIETDGSGRVYAGGDFGASGGTVLRRVAVWDPGARTWGPLGDGVASASGGFSFVQALALDPMGDVLITGLFDEAFDVPGTPVAVENIARFDVSAGQWAAFADGIRSSSSVQGLESDGTTVVIVGGNLAPASGSLPGAGSVLRWDGTAWQNWQGVVPGSFMRSLTLDGTGTFYLIPDVFTPSRVYSRRLGDASWTLLGTEDFELLELVSANVRRPVPDAYLGGVFNRIDLPSGGQVQAQNHARWTGTTWVPLAPGSGNTPPVITSLLGDFLGTEADRLGFDANGFDLDGDPLTYTWDLGDGSPPVTGLERDTLSHVYVDDGDYTLTVTVSDGGGTDATASQIVRVRNASPTIASLTGDTEEDVGATFAYTATATDPAGASDPLTYTWAFGDGTPPQSGVDLTAVSHVYAASGTYTLTLTVADDDGGSASVRLTVEVTEAGNTPPVITSLTGDPTGTVGTTLGFTAAATDADGDPLTFTWTFSDGSPPFSGIGATSAAHAYATAGAYTVTLTVTDGAGGTATATLPVVITDPGGPPRVSIAVANTTPTVPARGGRTRYTITVTNAEATPETVDAWLEVDLPDGRTRQFGPPATRTLQPGETLMATLSKRLQGGAPAGTYTVTGRVGQQAAGLVYDTDVFTFEKEGPPSRPAADMTIEPLLAAALDDVFVVPSEAFEIVAADVRGLPEAAGLLAPRPNPFASRTTLTVALPAPANVRLSVVDARGREVAVLAEGHREAGHHASVLEGGNLPPGVYLVRLLVDGQPLATRRVLLAR